METSRVNGFEITLKRLFITKFTLKELFFTTNVIHVLIKSQRFRKTSENLQGRYTRRRLYSCEIFARTQNVNRLIYLCEKYLRAIKRYDTENNLIYEIL